MKKTLSLLMSFVLVLTMISTTLVSVNAAGSDMATATSISFDKTYNGSITETTSGDFYKFTLSSAGTVNVNLKAYIYRTSYYLYDAEGNSVWSSTWQCWNGTIEVYSANWNLDLTKGTYYFVVCKSEGTGNYNFKMMFKTAGESFSELQGGDNQSVQQADGISLNKTYKGQIALNDNKDIYKFKLSKSTNVNLKLTAYIYRSSYYIYDADGNTVWNDWEYWNSNSQKLTLNKTVTLSAGTYYFAVQKVDGDTGNYSFSINCSHSWKNTVSKKATMSADGSGTKTCNVCGKKSNYTIPKIKSVALSATTYTYNGKVKTPSVTVKDSKGNTLKNGTDYTVSYASGRKNVGSYKVTVKFKGSYSGSKTLTFKIIPASTKITSTSVGSKKFTVKWNKVSSQVTGYQVQYSTSSSFSSATTKTVGNYKTTSKTISGLKKGKKYYVRVRTYKKVGDKNYYSSWSSAKSVRTK